MVETYEIAVFFHNKLIASTTCSLTEAPRSFARHVRDFMRFREDHMEAKFQDSSHFISFANPHLMIVMMGNVTKMILEITTKEVYYILMD
jgi:hypothetical protein